MKHVRAIAVLPTLFTLGNLVCGFFAIVVAARIGKPGTVERVQSPTIETARQLFDSGDPTHNLMLCGLLIFVAMICDLFDGQVARLTRTTSDFGGQLDSLCDIVSFGVAPAILLVKMCPEFTSVHREAVWSIAALFASCAALRLARFNVETDDTDRHLTFAGLPSPAAATVISSFAMLAYFLRNEGNVENATYEMYDGWLQLLLPPFAAVVALLMVSRIPYPHLVSQFLRRKRSFSQVVTLVFGLMILWAVKWYAVPILCGLYAAIPAIQHAWVLFLRSRKARQSNSSKAV